MYFLLATWFKNRYIPNKWCTCPRSHSITMALCLAYVAVPRAIPLHYHCQSGWLYVTTALPQSAQQYHCITSQLENKTASNHWKPGQFHCINNHCQLENNTALYHWKPGNTTALPLSARKYHWKPGNTTALPLSAREYHWKPGNTTALPLSAREYHWKPGNTTVLSLSAGEYNTALYHSESLGNTTALPLSARAIPLHKPSISEHCCYMRRGRQSHSMV